MHKRLLWLLNGAVLVSTAIVLLFHFAYAPDSNILAQNDILLGSEPA